MVVTTPILNEIYSRTLGIDKYSPYKERSLMREILPEDTKEEYKAVKVEQIGKETEKA